MEVHKMTCNKMKSEGYRMYDLDRFVTAQERRYAFALQEIRDGRKQGHWMWYIFPQMKGLGHSEKSQYYGIESAEEAKAYLAHPVLGKRLQEISIALLGLPTSDPQTVFGYTDSLKLRSSMTLFYQVSHFIVFERVLKKFFGGELDQKTISILEGKAS